MPAERSIDIDSSFDFKLVKHLLDTSIILLNRKKIAYHWLWVCRETHNSYKKNFKKFRYKHINKTKKNWL